MPDYPMITYWKGQCVDELTRDELLEVVKQLGRELQSTRDNWDTDRKMQQAFRDARAARRF